MARTRTGAGSSRNEEAPTNAQWNQILESLQTVTNLLQHQQQTYQVPLVPPQAPPVAAPEPPAAIPMINAEERKAKFLREFQKQNPPEFVGTVDPLIAEKWLKQTHKVLDIVGTPTEYQVEFATYQLQGEADFWWDSVKLMRDVSTLSWEEFVNLFHNHYFREIVKDTKMEEFVQLQQNNLMISQYVAKFLELSRFAPDFVSTEDRKT